MNRNNEWAVGPNLRAMRRDVGLEPEDVLRQARLPEDLLARENRRLPSGEYYRLWNAIIALGNTPNFPVGDLRAQTSPSAVRTASSSAGASSSAE